VVGEEERIHLELKQGLNAHIVRTWGIQSSSRAVHGNWAFLSIEDGYSGSPFKCK